MDSKELDDLIAELEESIILLQGRPGNHQAVASLEEQIKSLREKQNTL
jgi:hypothetical protein